MLDVELHTWLDTLLNRGLCWSGGNAPISREQNTNGRKVWVVFFFTILFLLNKIKAIKHTQTDMFYTQVGRRKWKGTWSTVIYQKGEMLYLNISSQRKMLSGLQRKKYRKYFQNASLGSKMPTWTVKYDLFFIPLRDSCCLLSVPFKARF